MINKNSEVIDAMIQNGISTEYKNIIDRNRCVPLHYAVMNNADITHLKLLETDTNSSMQDLNKCTPLHYAVELYHRLLQNRASREEIANAKEIIQALICQHPEYGTNINIKDQDGRTPLHYATLYGLQDIANIFIGTDHCNYTLQDTQRMTPLHYAVRSNSNDVLEVIVGKESIAQNIDIIGDKGLTPLHLAAIYGNKEAAEFLIGNNANVNAQDSEGRTALHLAVMNKQSEIVSLLLKSKGIVYTTKDCHGLPALFYAFDGNSGDSKAMGEIRDALVMAHKGKCDFMDDKDTGNINLIENKSMGNEENMKVIQNQIIEVLINKLTKLKASGNKKAICSLFNLDESAEFNLNWSDIHFAAFAGNQDIIQYLISHSVDINLQEQDENMTPIHIAVKVGNKSAVDVLLEKEVNLSIKDRNGNTPLHIAMLQKNLDIIILLYNKNANLFVKNNAGQTPWDLANELIRLAISSYLTSHTDKINTEIFAAVKNNVFSAVKLFTESGASITVKSPEDNLTLLHIAAKNGNHEILEYLILKGSDVKELDPNGLTILDYAILKAYAPSDDEFESVVRGGKSRLLQYLRERISAVESPNLENVKLLLSAGANMDDSISTLHNNLSKAKNEATLNLSIIAKDVAALRRSLSELLNVQQGNSTEEKKTNLETVINTPDYKGNTLLFYAIQKNSFEMVEALINSGAKINQDHKEHNSLIAYAVQNASYEIIELMINRGAILDPKINGDTLLHFAMLRKDSSGIFERTKEKSIAKILLEKGIENLNATTRNLRINMGHEVGEITQLMYIIDKNINTSLAITLIDKLTKEELNVADSSNKFTALSYAKRREIDEVEKALRTKGAFNVQEKEADTFLGSVKNVAKPLIDLASNKNLSGVATLLSAIAGITTGWGLAFAGIGLGSSMLRGDASDYECQQFGRNFSNYKSAGTGVSSGQAPVNQGDADNIYGAIKPYDKSVANVKIIQQTLMRIGYWVNSNTVPTGKYDYDTVESLINFQKGFIGFSDKELTPNFKKALGKDNHCGCGPKTSKELSKFYQRYIVDNKARSINVSSSQDQSENIWKIQQVLTKLECVDVNSALTSGVCNKAMDDALVKFQRKYMLVKESDACPSCSVSGYNEKLINALNLFFDERLFIKELYNPGSLGPNTIMIPNVKYYSQEDGTWCSQEYSSVQNPHGTMGDSGCGPTCMAMVVSTILGENITPLVLMKDAIDGGFIGDGEATRKTFYEYCAKLTKYRIPCHSTNDVNEVKRVLSDGNHIVIASMKKGHFCKVGHVIVLAGISTENSEERFIVFDPNRQNRNYFENKDDGIKLTDSNGMNGIVKAKISLIDNEKSVGGSSPYSFWIFDNARLPELKVNEILIGIEINGEKISGAVLVNGHAYAPIREVIAKLNGRILSTDKPEGVEVIFDSYSSSVFLNVFCDEGKNKVQLKHLADVLSHVSLEYVEVPEKKVVVREHNDEIRTYIEVNEKRLVEGYILAGRSYGRSGVLIPKLGAQILSLDHKDGIEIRVTGQNENKYLKHFYKGDREFVRIKDLVDVIDGIDCYLDKGDNHIKITKLTQDDIQLQNAVKTLNLANEYFQLLKKKPYFRYMERSEEIVLLQDILIKLGLNLYDEQNVISGNTRGKGFYGIETRSNIRGISKYLNSQNSSIQVVSGDKMEREVWEEVLAKFLEIYSESDETKRASIRKIIDAERHKEDIKIMLDSIGLSCDEGYTSLFNERPSLQYNKSVINTYVQLFQNIYLRLGLDLKIQSSTGIYGDNTSLCTRAIAAQMGLSEIDGRSIDKNVWDNGIVKLLKQYVNSDDNTRQLIRSQLEAHRLEELAKDEEKQKSGQNCFTEDTLIDIREGHRRIADIKEGDEVYSENPVTDEKGLKRVTRVFVRESETLRHIVVKDRDIRTTRRHPFYVIDGENVGWVEARKIKKGNKLLLYSGEIAEVMKAEDEVLSRPVKVYNFEVEDWHTYFVSEMDVFVHNCGHEEITKGSSNVYITKEQLVIIGYNSNTLTDKFLDNLNNTIDRFLVVNCTDEAKIKERICKFIAQISIESGFGSKTVESNYNDKEYFRKMYPGKDSREHKMGDIINIETGLRRYCGGGYIQLSTGSNYEVFSKEMNDPEIYNQGIFYVAENYSWEATGFWWKENGMNKFIDDGNSVKEVSIKVNGGENGLNDRIKVYNKLKELLRTLEPAKGL